MKQTLGLAALIAGMSVGCFSHYKPIEPFTPIQLPEVKNTVQTALDPRCELPGESGRCKAMFQKFYFNKTDKTCTKYIWGGCGDVKVPFETLEECEKACYK